MNFFGSNDSRTASPTKVTRVSKITSVPKAAVTIHGDVLKLPVPCLSNSPRLGVGGGNPKPRKSKAVIEVIADITINGINVTSVDSTLGRMCRKIILLLLAPRTRAAAT